MSRKSFKIKFLVFLMVILAGGVGLLATGLYAQDANEQSVEKPSAVSPKKNENAWVVRCDDIKEGEKVVGKYCEMAQSISVAEKGADPSTAQRLVEMAIGYPPTEKAKASVVVVLPLGIRVDEKLILEIDGRKEQSFDIRHCEASGCVALFTLSDKEITKLAKSNAMSIKTQAATGQPVTIELSLSGFANAHDQIKPKKD
jgi:invasion protein IalB